MKRNDYPIVPMSDIAKKVLWSIGLSIPSAAVGVILREVFQAWGIFDPFSEWLGGWLKMHVTPAQLEWTIAGILALLAYAALLWMVWRLHRIPPSVTDAASEQCSLKYLNERDSSLGPAIISMARQSAWGRWYAAQHLVNSGVRIGDLDLLQTAGSVVREKIVDGELEVSGDVLKDQGNLPEALKSYRDGLAIFDRLAKADPGNAGWQRDLSVSHAKLAGMFKRTGEVAAALDMLQRGRAITVRQMTLFPGNATWERDLAWFDGQIAELAQKPTGASKRVR